MASKFPRSPTDQIRLNICWMSWKNNLQFTGKDLMLTFWCQIPGDTFRSPCTDRSELFRLHEGDLYSIRQVVLMLWLISADVVVFSALQIGLTVRLARIDCVNCCMVFSESWHETLKDFHAPALMLFQCLYLFCVCSHGPV